MSFTPLFFVDCIKSLIPEFLGTYTYPNGFVTEAVGVGNTLGDIKVEGLEVIVPVIADIAYSTPTTGNLIYFDDCLNLTFIQRDQDVANLFQAVDKFRASNAFIIKGGSYYTQKQAHRTFHYYVLKIRIENLKTIIR